MLGFPLGIVSAAGAAVGEAGAYELIETHILASAASEVVFSSLATYASTYKHLQVRQVGRSLRADSFDTLVMRLNGDTGSNYTRHRLLGSGSSVSSESSLSRTNTATVITVGSTGTANAYAGTVIDILDAYSTTKNTTLRVLGGISSASVQQINLQSGLFIDTASISSLTIFSDTGSNLAAGSRFSLYGIKG